MAPTLTDLPPYVLQVIVSYLEQDIAQFNLTRQICKSLFMDRVLESQRNHVERLAFNKKENKGVNSTTLVVSLCVNYHHLQQLDLAYFTNLQARHINQIGLHCPYLNNLNLSGTRTSGINLHFFSKLKILNVSNTSFFLLFNFPSTSTGDTTVEHALGEAQPRHLHKLISICSKGQIDPSWLLERNITIDVICTRTEFDYYNITRCKAGADKLFELVANLADDMFPTPPEVMRHICSEGDIRSLEYLLQKGAHSNPPPVCPHGVCTNSNNHFVIRCLDRGQEDMAKLLIENGASTTHLCKHYGSALHYATSETMAKLLVDARSLAQVDHMGATPLHKACMDYRLDVTLYLLQHPGRTEDSAHLYDSYGKAAIDYILAKLHDPLEAALVRKTLVLLGKVLNRFVELGCSEIRFLPWVLTKDQKLVNIHDKPPAGIFTKKQFALHRLFFVLGVVVCELNTIEDRYKREYKETFAKLEVGDLFTFIKANRDYFVITKYGVKVQPGLQNLWFEKPRMARALPPPPAKVYTYTRKDIRSFRVVCFAGESQVKMSDQTLKLVKDIKIDDVISTPSGQSARVVCVVKTRCMDGEAELVTLESGLKITPYHPVRIDGKWQFPCNISAPKWEPCPFVYTFVLSAQHIMIINDTECVTLGHHFDEEVVRHGYFGTQAIINDLKRLEGWEEGLIEMEPNSFIRCENRGIIKMDFGMCRVKTGTAQQLP